MYDGEPAAKPAQTDRKRDMREKATEGKQLTRKKETSKRGRAEALTAVSGRARFALTRTHAINSTAH
jgi:hypothetical protein